ncbi:TldD/PmbA family protein [Stappia sp. F7233]|uniref:TldD/PmbA family protein n=1 Tax=Stappia albiluteola TaxID=2758565 RepID=A0A839AH03_9HYPH|nr:TldD/PmbA family protein [Stappia albiluteola]MBA5778366.1 TldD/PmbA family protein [Stappia albiluteola]
MTELVDQAVLEKRAAALVEAAKKAGADAADAVAVSAVSLGVDVREGKVEETERAEGDDFTLRVFVGRKVASVSANSLGDIAALAERAVAMAKVAPDDPYAGLADPGDLIRDMPALDLLDGTSVDAAFLGERARAAEAAGLDVAGVSKSGGASASWQLAGLVLAASNGFSGSYLTSRFGLSMTAVAGEGTGMERDYDYDYRTYLSDMDRPEDIGRRAGERAVRRLNPRKLSSRTADVIYETRAARSLVGHFAGAVNGAAIARKTSFLKDRMGSRVFAEGITITDDPRKPRSPATRPFDGEGLAALPLAMVEDGVLRHWFLDTATARELGLVSNGRASRGGAGPSPSATNLCLSPGKESPEAMMKAIGTGLLVTDLIGHGVNGVTGDYSRGASGFWIENGEIVYPVSEITLAGNLTDMFARLVPASDLDDRYSTAAPSILIEGMTIAGQ